MPSTLAAAAVMLWPFMPSIRAVSASGARTATHCVGFPATMRRTLKGFPCEGREVAGRGYASSISNTGMMVLLQNGLVTRNEFGEGLKWVNASGGHSTITRICEAAAEIHRTC